MDKKERAPKKSRTNEEMIALFASRRAYHQDAIENVDIAEAKWKAERKSKAEALIAGLEG
jgi:hypothetical protein